MALNKKPFWGMCTLSVSSGQCRGRTRVARPTRRVVRGKETLVLYPRFSRSLPHTTNSSHNSARITFIFSWSSPIRHQLNGDFGVTAALSLYLTPLSLYLTRVCTCGERGGMPCCAVPLSTEHPQSRNPATLVVPRRAYEWPTHTAAKHKKHTPTRRCSQVGNAPLPLSMPVCACLAPSLGLSVPLTCPSMLKHAILLQLESRSVISLNLGVGYLRASRNTC